VDLKKKENRDISSISLKNKNENEKIKKEYPVQPAVLRINKKKESRNNR
jgi:hypothetical protein